MPTVAGPSVVVLSEQLATPAALVVAGQLNEPSESVTVAPPSGRPSSRSVPRSWTEPAATAPIAVTVAVVDSLRTWKVGLADDGKYTVSPAKLTVRVYDPGVCVTCAIVHEAMPPGPVVAGHVCEPSARVTLFPTRPAPGPSRSVADSVAESP